MRLRLLLVIALCAPLAAAPQSPPQATFRSATKLIVTTVVVRNPDGTPVEGLTADDFVVTEDGVPQDIAFVEYQRLDNLQPLPPLRVAAGLSAELHRRPSSAKAGAVPSIVTPGIAVPPSGDATVSQPAPDHPVLRSLRTLTTPRRSACSLARRLT